MAVPASALHDEHHHLPKSETLTLDEPLALDDAEKMVGVPVPASILHDERHDVPMFETLARGDSEEMYCNVIDTVETQSRKNAVDFEDDDTHFQTYRTISELPSSR